jgi:peptidoglycan DL-endopeptidase CwlO
VQYVIWYRQIWLPSSGWKSYTRAYGDPSSDHTNHVHLSMRS